MAATVRHSDKSNQTKTPSKLTKRSSKNKSSSQAKILARRTKTPKKPLPDPSVVVCSLNVNLANRPATSSREWQRTFINLKNASNWTCTTYKKSNQYHFLLANTITGHQGVIVTNTDLKPVTVYSDLKSLDDIARQPELHNSPLSSKQEQILLKRLALEIVNI